MSQTPLILPYGGRRPRFASAPRLSGPGVALLGRITAGHRCRFGTGAVVRADGHDVDIGDDFDMGAQATVHIAHDVYGTRIGDAVTAGAGSVIHACTVGDGCHIGAGAVVLDGSVIGAGAALEPGAVVFPRSTLDGGWLYAGVPAKPLRPLAPEELAALHAATRAGDGGKVTNDVAYPEARDGAATDTKGCLFIAANARLAGAVVAEGGNSIWFGCILDAGAQQIALGRNTNIQDNSVLRAISAPLRIGRDSTIGHNVTMTDCSVGERSLIGIGAVVAPGSVVGDDVLLAAGAQTQAGQVLDAGWLYAGNPASKLRPLDSGKRDGIADIWRIYRDYALAYDAAQRAA